MAIAMATEHRALKHFVGPLEPFLALDTVSEVSINEPGVVFYDEAGTIKRAEVPELTLARLQTLAELIAKATSQVVSATNPLLSAWLPTGERVQIVLPPACPSGSLVMSIRKQSVPCMRLDDYVDRGAFDHTRRVRMNLPGDHETKERGASAARLEELVNRGEIATFLREAVAARKNIMVSGGTNTGKTTLMNALLAEIGDDERLVTIEDVRELELTQPNTAALIASKGEQGVAKVTPSSLLEAALRLRPDRILMGEIRGAEAYDFLEAINTGHEGSITSIHSNSPAAAFERLVMMGLRADLGLDRSDILAYAAFVIDVVIQLRQVDGQRVLTELYYAGT